MTPSSIVMNLAEEIDFENIFSVWSGENSFANSPDSKKDLKMGLENIFKNRTGVFNFWVLKNDAGEFIGYGSYTKGSFNVFRENISAEISVYVRQEYFHHGYGHQIMEYLIEEARASDLEYILAYVSVDNVASCKMVSRCGFEKIGIMPAYKSKGMIYHKFLYARSVNGSNN